MTILVTGGAGYIGSHTVKLLVEEGFEVIVFDNLSRGHRLSLPKKVQFELVELQNQAALLEKMRTYHFDGVIHFAALAYVGESVQHPKLYYQNNVSGTLNLLKAMIENNINKIVFSSTCSVYGNPLTIPITENESIKPINPYAKTKAIVEEILKDYDSAYGIKSISLRYFNAAGASLDGAIGESHEPETHLIPLVLYSALGKVPNITVFGTDYDTPDGTCLRDYIHVEDLATAHLSALRLLLKNNFSDAINLGTGSGNSVLNVINTAEKITGKLIPVLYGERRAGDPSKLVADNSKAKSLLNWQPKFGIEEIIKSAWNWHQNQKY